MIRNSIVILLAVFSLASCSSAIKPQKFLSIRQIEQLPLGSSDQDVLKSLGKPHAPINGTNEILWIYDNSNGDMQRASLSFDEDKKLQSKMIMPEESEPESSVDFVLKSKFSRNKFISVPFPQCGMDSVSGSALYADTKSGISFVYRKSRNEVETIGWSSPEKLKQNIADIENCKRNKK